MTAEEQVKHLTDDIEVVLALISDSVQRPCSDHLRKLSGEAAELLPDMVLNHVCLCREIEGDMEEATRKATPEEHALAGVSHG